MPRPAVATPADVRAAIAALLAEAGIAQAPSAQSFRRAVSVRKVRERLGGGNPATIGREINRVEAEVVAAAVSPLALPDIPQDIAGLMQQLWQAAVGVQLDDVVRLKTEAQALAADARNELAESQLRVDVLKQELGELRAALLERDARLARLLADQAARDRQLQALQQDLKASQAREAQRTAERDEQRQAQAEAVSAAQARYEGLSRRLLEETEQQRQAAQGELARMASQLKFADKRQAGLETRLEQIQSELAQARSEREQALGEVTALRYVNTSQRAQIDQIVRSLPPPTPASAAGLARGRKRTRATAPSGKRVRSGSGS